MARTITLVILVFSLVTAAGQDASAANRLLTENFDDGVLDARLTVFDKAWRALASPQYSLGSLGRNGSGRCFSSGTVSEAYLCWNRDLPSPWPTDELYVSFWMRYPTFRSTDTVNENIKLFYPHWDGTQSYVHYSMAQPDTVYYSAKAKGAMVAYGRWISCPGMTDGKWHRYEFYINFSRGVSQFRYDGEVLVDDEYGSGKWTNELYYISAPSIDAEETGVFSRQVDDLEVWDGIPGSGVNQSFAASRHRLAKTGPAGPGTLARGRNAPARSAVMSAVRPSYEPAARAFTPGYSGRLPVMASGSPLQNLMRGSNMN